MKYPLSMVGLVLGLFVSFPILANQDQLPYHDHPHMWSGGWHGGFFGPLMMIAFFVMLAIVIVLLVRWLVGTGRGASPHSGAGRTAMQILEERFAKGEIDRDEFEERRSVLKG